MWLALRRNLDNWRKTDAVIDHSRRPRRHLRGVYYAALWVLWVLTGTLFYAYAPKSVSAVISFSIYVLVLHFASPMLYQTLIILCMFSPSPIIYLHVLTY